MLPLPHTPHFAGMRMLAYQTTKLSAQLLQLKRVVCLSIHSKFNLPPHFFLSKGRVLKFVLEYKVRFICSWTDFSFYIAFAPVSWRSPRKQRQKEQIKTASMWHKNKDNSTTAFYISCSTEKSTLVIQENKSSGWYIKPFYWSQQKLKTERPN